MLIEHRYFKFSTMQQFETSRIAQALWWQLRCFYQILQFCIKLLARQVFANVTAEWYCLI